MMTRAWQKAASTAKLVMDLGEYDLYTDGDRTSLFSSENQLDNEFIFVAEIERNPNLVQNEGY